MRQSVAAELLILRKRAATWILLVIWTTLGVFFSYIVPYVADPERLEKLLPGGLAGNLIAGFPFFGGVFALMLGVFAIGSEYGWDTLKTLFTQGPDRLRLLAAKLIALGVALLSFVLALFAAGAITSYVIAQIEGAPGEWPSLSLLVRTIAAGWLILAVWAALGVLLGVLTRGTSLAIGIGILYALVIEWLVSVFADLVGVLEPLNEVFLRANAYAIADALRASVEPFESSGPAVPGGPFIGSAQALVVLGAYIVGFLLLSAVVLRRRDVA